MGSSTSIEVPGGGCEGYHVLRVSKLDRLVLCNKKNIVGKFHYQLTCFYKKIVPNANHNKSK